MILSGRQVQQEITTLARQCDGASSWAVAPRMWEWVMGCVQALLKTGEGREIALGYVPASLVSGCVHASLVSGCALASLVLGCVPVLTERGDGAGIVCDYAPASPERGDDDEESASCCGHASQESGEEVGSVSIHGMCLAHDAAVDCHDIHPGNDPPCGPLWNARHDNGHRGCRDTSCPVVEATGDECGDSRCHGDTHTRHDTLQSHSLMGVTEVSESVAGDSDCHGDYRCCGPHSNLTAHGSGQHDDWTGEAGWVIWDDHYVQGTYSVAIWSYYGFGTNEVNVDSGNGGKGVVMDLKNGYEAKKGYRWDCD